MKLNLGCGTKLLPGFINVDFRDIPGVQKVNLEEFPWPWPNASCEEIVMWDCLEHFSYRLTEKILAEMCRVLKTGGTVDIQVPDFDHCAMAVLNLKGFKCNQCGFSFDDNTLTKCQKCCQELWKIQEAAIHRLYGGQKEKNNGDWHFVAFNKKILQRKLSRNGFGNFEELEKEHQWDNWNFRLRAEKLKWEWSEDE